MHYARLAKRYKGVSIILPNLMQVTSTLGKSSHTLVKHFRRTVRMWGRVERISRDNRCLRMSETEVWGGTVRQSDSMREREDKQDFEGQDRSRAG